ncbi:MAG TPA: CoA-transferase [Anaerolineales bacterium]|nr:CoA-transferase [Anaerolineales bacterium]
MSDYTPSEMMIVSASRALQEARTVLVGVGLPNIACNLARRTVAPDLELIYESGVLGARPARLPLSIGDPSLVSGSLMAASMPELFLYYLQGGRVDVALLGTAQIDRFGNLNTTVIGDYHHPKVRLPGSGGACEMAIHAREVMVITRLEGRSFVERLDFRTSPGFLEGGGSRAALHLPGGGPRLVVTDLAIFGFDPESKEMVLRSVHPGVEVEQLRSKIAWPLAAAANLEHTEPPSAEELRIVRDELDPGGLYR